MATRRTYQDRCGIARALNQIGERWSLLIVRELILGPKRFTDLRAGLPGVTADVLTERLRELEQTEIVVRVTLPPPLASRVYKLTERGRRLEPVLLALGRWGTAVPFPRGSEGLSVDALGLALKTLFDPAKAQGAQATYQLTVNDHPLIARVAGTGFELTRGEAEDPDAAITADPGTFAGVLWHGTTLTDAVREGAIELGGDRRLARKFFTLFPQAAVDP